MMLYSKQYQWNFWFIKANLYIYLFIQDINNILIINKLLSIQDANNGTTFWGAVMIKWYTFKTLRNLFKRDLIYGCVCMYTHIQVHTHVITILKILYVCVYYFLFLIKVPT